MEGFMSFRPAERMALPHRSVIRLDHQDLATRSLSLGFLGIAMKKVA